jgi:hypothetical protein
VGKTTLEATQTVSFASYVDHIENVDATAVFTRQAILTARPVSTTVNGNLATSDELFWQTSGPPGQSEDK